MQIDGGKMQLIWKEGYHEGVKRYINTLIAILIFIHLISNLMSSFNYI
jgi:hypothetical protein